MDNRKKTPPINASIELPLRPKKKARLDNYQAADMPIELTMRPKETAAVEQTSIKIEEDIEMKQEDSEVEVEESEVEEEESEDEEAEYEELEEVDDEENEEPWWHLPWPAYLWEFVVVTPEHVAAADIPDYYEIEEDSEDEDAEVEAYMEGDPWPHPEWMCSWVDYGYDSEDEDCGEEDLEYGSSEVEVTDTETCQDDESEASDELQGSEIDEQENDGIEMSDIGDDEETDEAASGEEEEADSDEDDSDEDDSDEDFAQTAERLARRKILDEEEQQRQLEREEREKYVAECEALVASGSHYWLPCLNTRLLRRDQRWRPGDGRKYDPYAGLDD